MKARRRRYDIVRTNCDCCASRMAVRSDVHRVHGPRCPGCHRIIGCMQHEALGDILATGEFDALDRWDAAVAATAQEETT